MGGGRERLGLEISGSGLVVMVEGDVVEMEEVVGAAVTVVEVEVDGC